MMRRVITRISRTWTVSAAPFHAAFSSTSVSSKLEST